MKIAVLCDLRLPAMKTASQYDVLSWAMRDLEKEKPDLTMVCGDITAMGEVLAIERFTDAIKDISHMLLLGNADLRDEFRLAEVERLAHKSCLRSLGGFQIIGINAPRPRLSSNDKQLLEGCKDGAIVFTHHYPDSFEAESKNYLYELLGKKKLLFIHGHKHIEMESKIGESTIIGVRGLDPDKAQGLPCVSYFEFSENGFVRYENCFGLNQDRLSNVWSFLGISCFRPGTDIDYAADRKIKNIEIRKYDNPENFDVIINKAEKWRQKGGAISFGSFAEFAFAKWRNNRNKRVGEVY